jgi:hypothetical protein
MCTIEKQYDVERVNKDGSITSFKMTRTWKRTKYFSLEDKQKMKQMLSDGYSKYEICSTYKISMPTLNKYLKSC